MNILRINFDELYQRHLCRHGQFGINLWHVLSVYGLYFSIYSLVAFVIRTLLPRFTPIESGLLLLLLSVPYSEFNRIHQFLTSASLCLNAAA